MYPPRIVTPTRLLLLLALPAGVLACSEKPTAEPAPATKESAGAVAAATEAPAPTAAPIDRSPIAVKEAKEKLVLSATTLDKELLGGDSLYVHTLENRVLALHPLRDRMLVSLAGYVAVLQDHRLELKAPITFAFPETCEVLSVTGVWPQGVLAQVEVNTWGNPSFMRVGPDGRDSQTKLTRHDRWDGRGWSGATSLPWTRAAGWSDGASLLLVQAEPSPGGAPVLGRSLRVVSPAGKSEPTPPKQAAPRDAAACSGAKAEVLADELDAVPSGEAFVLGKRCGGGGYAMERWAAGAAESVIEDLPDAPKEAKRAFLSAGARDRVHVALSTGDKVYVARWDGRAFRKIEIADEGEVRGLWTAADGALFLVVQPKPSNPKRPAELLRVLPDGQLHRSTGFVAGPNLKIWAADAQTAYFVSYTSVFSTKPGLVFTQPEGEKPKAEEPKKPEPPASALPAFAEGCATPLVFLYDISEQSPQGFDFPMTRKALATFEGLADISLIEFAHASKRKLGVRVPSAEVGRKVVAHVLATMKNERPELVCFDPKEGVRTIAIGAPPRPADSGSSSGGAP